MNTHRLKLAPLRERPDLCPYFADAFKDEWPDWYGPGGEGDAEADLAAFANPHGDLPVGIVAMTEDGTPIGIAALKAGSIPSHSHLSPWATAGLVLPAFRGRGVGAQLLAALLAEASRLGHDRVYCATSTSAWLLSRAGWQLIDDVTHDNQMLQVFRCSVAEHPRAIRGRCPVCPDEATGS